MWTRAPIARERRSRRMSVIPLSTRNVACLYLCALDGFGRKTNTVKEWHSKFQRIDQTHHANIWRILLYIHRNKRDNNILITQLRAAGYKGYNII